jgi:aspartyl protease family protein
VLVFVGIQWLLREQQQMRFRADGDIIEIRRGVDGHYHWPGTINGRSVDFLIDTGATGTCDLDRAGARARAAVDRQVQSSTAGGPVTGQVVRADVTLQGGVRAERLRLVALPQLADGRCSAWTCSAAALAAARRRDADRPAADPAVLSARRRGAAVALRRERSNGARPPPCTMKRQTTPQRGDTMADAPSFAKLVPGSISCRAWSRTQAPRCRASASGSHRR